MTNEPLAAPSEAVRHDLNEAYPLREEQIRCFREQGFIRLKGVLAAETIAYFDEVITVGVVRHNTMRKPMQERSTYERAFLQVMNLWRVSEEARALVFSRKLARLAAELMGVPGVRLYHDQALYKEPGGGFTPWHADQYYWPLSSSNCCTAWIPLQETPPEMGPLAFSVGSHHLQTGRDLGISDESETKISRALLDAGLPLDERGYDVGEISFHLGWTFHRAGPNESTTPRRVMTIITMEDGIRLAEPANVNQMNDRNAWLPGAVVGEVIDTPLNPVLYRA